jgi:hypothetical protein
MHALSMLGPMTQSPSNSIRLRRSADTDSIRLTPDVCSVYAWTYDSVTLQHHRVKEVSRHRRVCCCMWSARKYKVTQNAFSQTSLFGGNCCLTLAHYIQDDLFCRFQLALSGFDQSFDAFSSSSILTLFRRKVEVRKPRWSFL